jgi:nicotinate-nucleotide adenylyltransferase
MEMLRRAIAGQAGLVADDSELRRNGPSYMVDTLAGFRERYGDAVPLVLIIGQDAANALDAWHEWRALFELAHIAVMRRPEAGSGYRGELAREMRSRRVSTPRDLLATPCGKVLPVHVTQLEISSTAIRSLVEAGRSAAYLTPEPVIKYIREHGLYQGSE